jgi:hypothetical protein
MRFALGVLLVCAAPLGASDEPPREPEGEPDPAPRAAPGNPFGDDGPGGPFYRAEWYPQRPVIGQASDFGMVRQQLNLGAPVWRDRDAGHMLIGNVRVRHTQFDTAAVLPESGRAFPGELWNVSFGATYIHKLENGWTAGGSLQIGSASDKPFNGIREMTLGGIAFLRVPAHRDPDTWTFGLAYFPNGQINFPLPSVAYDWNPTDRLRVSIGLPFAVRWQPTDEWLVQIRYRPLTQVDARVSWTPHERVTAFGGFEWTNEGYFLAGRPNRDDRFFGFEKRLFAGVTVYPHKRIGVEASTGYAFDRVYGTGQTRRTAEDRGVEIGPGAFLALAVRGRF